MITTEQAITDLKNHITFEDDGDACTTQGEVIILLESAKLEKSRLESDKQKLAEFIINNWHSCPIPGYINCKSGFQSDLCVECLLKHLDLLNLKK